MPPCVVPWAVRELWRPLDDCLVTGAFPMFERMATAAITAALVTATAPRTSSATSTETTIGSVVSSVPAAHATVMRPARRCAAIPLILAIAGGCLAEDTTVPVVPPPPPDTKVVQLVVEPGTASLSPGESQRFAAYGLTADGRHVDGPVLWSANGGTITPDGVFTADTAAGSFSVTASSNTWGLAATASVRVLPRRRVVSVAVRPDTATVPIQGSWRFQAILLDSAGDSLGGRLVSWRSTDTTVAVVDSTGLVTGLAPGTATITAVSEGTTGSALISVVRPGSGPWPNEPSGFKGISDQPWDAVTSLGWELQFGVLPTIVPDPTAPLSPPNVLQITYPIGFASGAAPSTVIHSVAGTKQLYIGIWWKASNPWQGNVSNSNKIQYVFTDADGSAFMVMYGTPGGPYELRVFPQFKTSSDIWLVPNVVHVPVTLGKWHKIEWLLVYNTTTDPPNGICRWWLDGQLIGDYGNVSYPSAPLVEYKVAPVFGGVGTPKTETDYFWYDHVHLSGR